MKNNTKNIKSKFIFKKEAAFYSFYEIEYFLNNLTKYSKMFKLYKILKY